MDVHDAGVVFGELMGVGTNSPTKPNRNVSAEAYSLQARNLLGLMLHRGKD